MSEETKRQRPQTQRRRRPHTRQTTHRGVKRVLIAAVVVTVLALGVRWLLQQPYFRVQHVTVTGNVHETAAAVETALGLTSQPSMLGLNTGAMIQAAKTFPWVANASIVKHWPNSVSVSIVETHAVAVTQWQGKWTYVGATGTNLGLAPATANLPTLITLAATTWPFTATDASAVTVAATLPSAFASQVRDVVAGTNGVSLTMTTPVRFILGSTDELTAKYMAIASVIKGATLAAGDVVDVTVPTELAISGPSPH